MGLISLVVAGFCELGFVVLLKKSEGFRLKSYGILSMIVMGMSLYLLSIASKTIPIGTAYAIWAGIGASASVLWGMIFFGESRSFKKIIFVTLIIIGVVGLKLTSH